MKLATRVTHTLGSFESKTEPISPPITLASVYRFRDISRLAQVSSGRKDDWFYRRFGHLNSRLLEACVADLEGAEEAVALGAGMAACATLFWATFAPGDHVVATEDLYGGSYAFFTGPLRKLGVEVTLAPSDPAAMESAIRPNTKALYFETISNPLMKVADMPKLVAIARRHRLLTIVDSTFATPYHVQPIQFGIDLVFHSATKFLGGHGDALGGIIAGSHETIRPIRKLAIGVGSTISPMDAWLILRGVKTLHVRLQTASKNALQLAKFLKRHSRIRAVNYPGISRIPRVLSHGSGAMLSFRIKGDPKKFVRHLKLVEMVPSLGDVSTTITHPWTSSHAYLPEQERLRIGVGPDLIRVSVGIDDPEDVQADFDQALRRS